MGLTNNVGFRGSDRAIVELLKLRRKLFAAGIPLRQHAVLFDSNDAVCHVLIAVDIREDNQILITGYSRPFALGDDSYVISEMPLWEFPHWLKQLKQDFAEWLPKELLADRQWNTKLIDQIDGEVAWLQESGVAPTEEENIVNN